MTTELDDDIYPLKSVPTYTTDHTTHFDDCGCKSAMAIKLIEEQQKKYVDERERLREKLSVAREALKEFKSDVIRTVDINMEWGGAISTIIRGSTLKLLVDALKKIEEGK